MSCCCLGARAKSYLEDVAVAAVVADVVVGHPGWGSSFVDCHPFDGA